MPEKTNGDVRNEVFGLRRAPNLAQQMAMGQHLAGMHDKMTQQGPCCTDRSFGGEEWTV